VSDRGHSRYFAGVVEFDERMAAALIWPNGVSRPSAHFAFALLGAGLAPERSSRFRDLGRFLRVRLKTSSRIAELSQHEADGGEFQEGKTAAVEIFPVLGETAAAVEPSDRTLDDPTLG
jgi:hypothetical protein